MEGFLRLTLYIIVWFFVPAVLVIVIRFLARAHKRLHGEKVFHNLHMREVN